METGASLFFSKHERYQGGFTKNYWDSNEIVGYAPKKNLKVSAQKFYDKKLIYDATYTTDKNGLRITPAFDGGRSTDAILFFGCSFMFGEGLNDDETLPFLVGSRSQEKTYNFGVSGYGPHQMLSELEHGMVSKIVDTKVKYAIFETGPFQIERPAGYLRWGQHSPKYILSQDGTVIYAGHFDDSLRTRIINNLVKKSSLYQNFFKDRNHNNLNNDKLYTAIIIAAKNEIKQLYPNSEFHIIYWDYGKSKENTMIFDNLQKENIKIHLISTILPNWHKDQTVYKIGHGDGHPNLKANTYIADYIIQNILH